jgi:anti-sigma-K factor RskA
MKHTELTDDLQEQASLYAAGAMSESERQEYARHLDEDQCSVCRSEVHQLQSAIALLAFTVPASSPSPNVKARLMEQARKAAPVAISLKDQPRSAFRWMEWITAAVAVASMAVAFMVIRTNNELRQEADLLKSKIAQLEVQITGHQNTIATLTSAGVRVVDMAGQGTNVQAKGRIFWDQQRKRWFFYVRDLPPVPADKSYQLWFVPKSGNPVSATVFNTGSDGTVQVEVPVPDDVADLKAAAVTTEPLGGLPQPSGPFALLGAM